jgi:hypothetical protein
LFQGLPGYSWRRNCHSFRRLRVFSYKKNITQSRNHISVLIWRNRRGGSPWMATWLSMCGGSTDGGRLWRRRSLEPGTRSILQYERLVATCLVNLSLEIVDWDCTIYFKNREISTLYPLAFLLYFVSTEIIINTGVNTESYRPFWHYIDAE